MIILEKSKSDFTELLNQLRDNKIKTLTIQPNEFFIFQQAFMAFETRKKIVGRATNGGTVIYHYDHSN
ncbi:hypothetical protein R4B61_04135 [Fructilactobacillus vespulae]|uniref:hypothetical protein n=1 Tax=Fructilactobacillus vespulae TaxID=1249630 RepID=UPI0039B63550